MLDTFMFVSFHFNGLSEYSPGFSKYFLIQISDSDSDRFPSGTEDTEKGKKNPSHLSSSLDECYF